MPAAHRLFHPSNAASTCASTQFRQSFFPTEWSDRADSALTKNTHEGAAKILKELELEKRALPDLRNTILIFSGKISRCWMHHHF